jgi:hypothetical protein
MSFMGAEQLDFILRITTMVVPVALYFFILGFLNTRLHPQLLTGRQDFILLTAALSPLAFGPLVYYFGNHSAILIICAGLIGLGGFLLAPRGRSLVIYNISFARSVRAVVDTLNRLGRKARISGRRVEVDDGETFVEIDCFPLLRSISLRQVNGDRELWADFEQRLAGRMREIDVIPRPMAVSLLLVSTGMIVAPLALVVRHAPEIVRILGDLVQ